MRVHPVETLTVTAYLRCIQCSQSYAVTDYVLRCTRCGDLLDVSYNFQPFDPKTIKIDFLNRRLSPAVQDQSGVWRFRELLPFIDDLSSIVSLREGNTPLLDVPHLAAHVGLQSLWVKQQGMNPTGSFKDNGMTTAITQAKRLRVRTVLCASTGNTSASMAAYASRADTRAVVLIPQGLISMGKLAQAIDYGATVVQIEGDFDRAMQLVRDMAQDQSAYVLNSLNPFRIEGQKTLAIEMMEQRGWRPPDRVVLPGGNLGNCSALGKAFRELFDLKLISRIPKLTVVQAKGANPFVQMIRSHSDVLSPVRADTLASAINIGNPVSWKKALRALEWTAGDVLEVTENEIADARALLAREGIGCEPASASTIAGILQLSRDKKLRVDEEIVAVLTGHQLKDPEYIMNYHAGALNHKGVKLDSKYKNAIRAVPADVEALKRVLLAHDE